MFIFTKVFYYWLFDYVMCSKVPDDAIQFYPSYYNQYIALSQQFKHFSGQSNRRARQPGFLAKHSKSRYKTYFTISDQQRLNWKRPPRYLRWVGGKVSQEHLTFEQWPWFGPPKEAFCLKESDYKENYKGQKEETKRRRQNLLRDKSWNR